MGTTTIIDILRHGQPEGGDIFRGSTDVVLTPLGWQQMQISVDKLKVPWEKVVSSPLKRCADFSQKLNDEKSIPVDVNNEFREIHFGDWDGKLVSEISQTDEAFMRLWKDPDNFCAPNGENFQDFSRRVNTAWNELHQSHIGQHILLVTHGGVIRALLSELLNMPRASMNKFDVPYASLSRVKIYQSSEGVFTSLVFHGGPHG